MYTSTFKEQFFSSYLNGDYLYLIFSWLSDSYSIKQEWLNKMMQMTLWLASYCALICVKMQCNLCWVIRQSASNHGVFWRKLQAVLMQITSWFDIDCKLPNKAIWKYSASLANWNGDIRCGWWIISIAVISSISNGNRQGFNSHLLMMTAATAR